MVCLLLGRRDVPIPGLAAANDVVHLLESVDLHMRHVFGVDAVPCTKLEQALQDRLRMALGVVALDRALREAAERFLRPIDLDSLTDHLLPTLGPFHEVERTRDAPGREQCHVHAGHRGLGRRKSLPPRQAASPDHPQSVGGAGAEGDRVGALAPVQAERADAPGRD